MKKKWSYGCVIGAALWLTGCSSSETIYRSVDTAMGTVVQQTIYSTGEDCSEDVLKVLTDLENQILSWRVEDSEIAQMNAAAGGEFFEMSKQLTNYMEKIFDVAEQSGGAFDPTVGLITREWDVDGENPHIPDGELLKKLVEDAGYEKIVREDNQIWLPEDVTLDLGAAGKGIGCDEVRTFLQGQKEVKGAVIAVGGSILTYGEKTEGGTWNVGIQNPRESSSYLGVLRLEGDWCISTSGDYERYFEENGVRYHHIMNPDTGYPADSGLISVTVLCQDGLLSDALSTACFILGVEESLELVQHYGAYAILVDKEKNVYCSDFQGAMSFELTADDYCLM
ncbi:MAG: FAD:protein FMN transferase [Lachnospiraceae bacterium]